jgi:hypothetical protein
MSRKRKLLPVMVVSLLAVGLLGGVVFAQGTGKSEGVTGIQAEGKTTTITGKIAYMESLGGYVVISERPHEEYKIINVNEAVLGPLAKAGKSMTIEGSLRQGAYLLFIDKIDGKKYQGAK